VKAPPLLERRVLVVDDETSILEIVSTALRRAGWNVTEAASGWEARHLARSRTFDLLVLDVMLPDIDGFEICRTLRAEGIEAAVLFLTARTASADATRGLEFGGDDYVRKPFELDELLARAEALIRRAGGRPEPRVLRLADIVVNLDAHLANRDGVALDLTPTEFRLLEALVRNRNRVLTRSQILELVWNDPEDRDITTIETAMSRLRRKLDSLGASVLETRRGVGYGAFEPGFETGGTRR